jgi:Methyltransferase domain
MAVSAGLRTSPSKRSEIDERVAKLPQRLRWTAGAVRFTLREPTDGLDRARIRLLHLFGRDGPSGPPPVPEPEWHRLLHERVGLEWPCTATSAFDQLWVQIADELRTHGLSLGRGTYGGWDDADPRFALAIWCLMIHLRPTKVVETGVARGVTSRVILEALRRSGAGHLWSIDLPAMDPTLHWQVGIAVPDNLREGWTYIAGTSRRRLPKLLSQIGPIELFVHDSSHTERNILFELRRAWAATDRGVVVADDVHQNAGFAKFTAALPEGTSYVVEADDANALFGMALKLGRREPGRTEPRLNAS